MMRTRYCGLFRPEHVGERAAVAGWVDTVRDMGGVVFLDVRDREGVMQVVCDQSALDVYKRQALSRSRSQ